MEIAPEHIVDLVTSLVQVLIQLIAYTCYFRFIILLAALLLTSVNVIPSCTTRSGGAIKCTQSGAKLFPCRVAPKQPLQLQGAYFLKGETSNVGDLLLIVLGSGFRNSVNIYVGM